MAKKVTIEVKYDTINYDSQETHQEVVVRLRDLSQNSDPKPRQLRYVDNKLTFATFKGVLESNAVTAATVITAQIQGVSIIGGIIPDALFVDDLSDSTPDGIVSSEALPFDGNDMEIGASTDEGALGSLRATAGGNEYSDGVELTNAKQVYLVIRNRTALDYVLPTGVLTLNFSANKSLTVVLTQPITVPGEAGGSNRKEFWLDESGRLYKKFSLVNGVTDGPYPYDDSVVSFGAQ